jgi:hypothetical protein
MLRKSGAYRLAAPGFFKILQANYGSPNSQGYMNRFIRQFG